MHPVICSLLVTVVLSGAALAWSEPHKSITKAAIEVLPEDVRDLLGTEKDALWDNYCLIPDHVFTDRPNARFAVMESRPREVYLQNLHLPSLQPENLETLRYFFGKAVHALRENQIDAAARFMGTVCHQIEDYGSPAHTVPGDNMFTLLQQFLPPPDAMKDQLLHSPIESGDLVVTIPDYRPRLLGTSVEEASWRLLHRINEAIINARSTTIPIIQALYAGDDAGVKAWQMRAASFDARVVADALFTILLLGTNRVNPEGARSLETVGIGSFFPLEAENLYFPQKQFSGSPNWGHARSGVILAEGKRAVPLKLLVQGPEGGREMTFTNGVSGVMGKSLTYLLPRGVYSRFSVYAGMHPELGANGKVEFVVTGDGEALAKATIGGDETAQRFECEISGIAELQLTLISRGDPKSQYAIWGDPTVWRASGQ